jgi:hypothetical protein
MDNSRLRQVGERAWQIDPEGPMRVPVILDAAWAMPDSRWAGARWRGVDGG